ncbi:MAG: CoA transferase [Deltaproteobacteria bacterium]|nr:CoA transferase [Deltaproteobacteria bacterium]
MQRDDSQAPPPAALGTLRVMEYGTGVATAFCARLLADFGATVFKIEPPTGDPLRHHGLFPGDKPHPDHSALFAYLNAGKQSVALTGDHEADRTLLARHAGGADVLVTDLLPAERATCNLDEISAGGNMVTVCLPAIGSWGAFGGRRAYDLQVCALSAASIILGEPKRPPLHFPFHLPALQAGMHGAAAALSALLARRRCGRGQAVEVAATDVLAFYTGGMSRFILGSGGSWRRRGFERHGTMYPSGFYPCRDGFIFIATQTRAQWTGFLRLMGNPQWAQQDPVLQDGVRIGWARADEVDLHFIPWLTQYTRRELADMARQADLVLGPINNVDDLFGEPHLEARRFWAEVSVGETTVRMPGMGYAMSATPWRLGRVPRLGEHAQDAVASAVAPARPPSRPPARIRRPLEGYRALEFGFNWAGPLVGQILADLGMEVIKVETNARLDFMRHWQHARKFFHNANRGKLSVSVNLKQAGGIELVRRLAGRVDVVFDNFAAGVMARNGLGYDDLRQVKPDLVVLSMAMAGQTGPLKHLRGFATIATGFAGLESAIGYPDTGSTGLPLLGIGDTNAAIQGVYACLVALWHREHTGQGQFIDLSQIEAAATLAAEPLCDFQINGRVAAPQANRHPWMAPHGTYPAAGKDRWVAVAVGSNAEWQALVQAMGEPSWAKEPAFNEAHSRYARQAEIDARLAQWTAAFDRDALVERLQAAGVAAAPVLEIDEVRTHPHFQERQLCQEIRSFEGSPELVYNTPWHFSLTARGVDRPSPQVGEHNHYVFGELLGMTAEEIQHLAEQQVMW